MVILLRRTHYQLFRPQGTMSDPRNPFGSTKINWAENILLSHSSAKSSKITAVVSLIEPPAGGNAAVQTARYTFSELYDQVKFAAAGLKKLGVGPGDRVAAVTSNNAGEPWSGGLYTSRKRPDRLIRRKSMQRLL